MHPPMSTITYYILLFTTCGVSERPRGIAESDSTSRPQGPSSVWRRRRCPLPACALLRRSLAKGRFAQADSAPAHVRDRVWIGSVGAASNGAALRDNGITHVLSLCPDELPRQADVHYHVVQDLPDAPAADMRTRLPALCDFIQDSLDSQTERSEPAVLVNCFQGKSRSAAVVAAFLIRKHGLTVAQGASARCHCWLRNVRGVGLASALRPGRLCFARGKVQRGGLTGLSASHTGSHWFLGLPHWLALVYRPLTLSHTGLSASHTGSHWFIGLRDSCLSIRAGGYSRVAVRG